MKKIVSTVLMTVMILSLLAGIAILPASADDSGDWVVYTSPVKYFYQGDETSDPEAPIPGYNYTEEGFVVTPMEFTGANTPRFNVMTKEPVYIKDGVSLKVRIDALPYSGDNWVSFSIWSDHNVEQGNDTAQYGEGWYDLIRFTKDRFGNVNPTAFQGYINDMDYYNPLIGAGSTEAGGSPFAYMDNPNFTVTPHNVTQDDQGRVYLEMNIIYNAETDHYNLYVSGVEVRNDIMDDYLKHAFPDGFAYIGFSVQDSGNGTAGITILELNGQVPTGTDSAEPYVYDRTFGPMIDSSTIPEGEPALLLNALNEKGDYKVGSNGLHFGGLCFDYSFNGDKIHAITDQVNPKAIIVAPKDEISYEASDFPYVVMLLRDYCACVLNPGDSCYDKADGFFGDYLNPEEEPGEVISMYFCAGDTLKPDDDHRVRGYSLAGTWLGGDGHEYKLIVFDLDDEGWAGRINLVQINFDNMQIANDAQRQMDICYVGFFRDYADLENYAESYAASQLPDAPAEDESESESAPAETESTPVESESTSVETEPVVSETEPTVSETEPTVSETEPAVSETEPAVSETKPAETKPAETKPAETKPAETKPADNGGAKNEDKGGCGSVACVSAIAIAITAAAAGALCFKKKED